MSKTDEIIKQIKELSTEERVRIRHTLGELEAAEGGVIRKLDEEGMDELVFGMQYLLPADRAVIYERLRLIKDRRQFLAKVTIDDWHGHGRQQPSVIIVYPDGTLESFDIIESVRQNAASIGHPFILIAIRRWEQVIRYYRSVSDATFQKPFLDNDDFYTIARRHLAEIAKALLNGAEERAVKKEDAIAVCMQGWLRGFDYYILKKAWNLLAEQDIKRIRSLEKKLSTLEKRLRTDSPMMPSYVESVVSFIKSEAGQIFLTKRKSWQVVRSEFDSWSFGLSKSTLRTYRSKAKQKESVDLEYLRPDLNNGFYCPWMGDWFFLPTVSRTSKESPEKRKYHLNSLGIPTDFPIEE